LVWIEEREHNKRRRRKLSPCQSAAKKGFVGGESREFKERFCPCQSQVSGEKGTRGKDGPEGKG